MASPAKWFGSVVEYLDQGHFRAGLVVREQDRHVAVVDITGHERLVSRDAVMLHHPELRPSREQASAVLADLQSQREALATELDLGLLWEVSQEQGRGFSAAELAELFFGQRSTLASSVMLEALLNDRLFFVRRHLEFIPRPRDQVERLRLQQDRIKGRSEGARRTQALIREILNGGETASSEETAALAAELTLYLRNPFTRSRELTQILAAAAPDIDPAEVSFEVLDRLGAKPDVPRFAFIAGLHTEFSAAALEDAGRPVTVSRPALEAGLTVTIDDDDTVEIDDALSCELLSNGDLRIWVHIALVADFVTKGSALDEEAAARATTVYLPEINIPMLPETISSARASLVEGQERPVLTTAITLTTSGEIGSTSIYPGSIRIGKRLDYAQADRMLADSETDSPIHHSLRLLRDAADRSRDLRRRSGALLMHRREPKVTVRGDDIQIHVLDSASLSRVLVAEFMVLSNFVAARFAAENRIPIIYRVQPETRGEPPRPRLSLYPEYHAGIGLDYYAQLSSPIRRYADLVLQRQLVGSLSEPSTQPYSIDELLKVLANAESAEANGRELERRAKRYWILRYLEKHALDRPLAALSLRDSATAELTEFAIRGTLRGAPNLPDQTPILARISRVDPLRGWLAVDYVRRADNDEERHPA